MGLQYFPGEVRFQVKCGLPNLYFVQILTVTLSRMRMWA